jgi:putative DNA primase/helicase
MENAIDYVAEGMALVGIPPRKKGPTAKGWNKAESVITDTERARALVGNVGIAHAYSTPTTMALDIDELPKARAWFFERGVNLDALLADDDGVQISSGRPGRAKLIYRLPDGVAPIATKQITDPKTSDMVLEFRCATANGLTVQDVLPPSIHPETGQPYKWGGKGDWRSIPEIPDQLMEIWQSELCARGEKRVRIKTKLGQNKAAEDTPRERARLAEMLANISADCSYERYRNIVWAILSLGWHDSEQIAQAWCKFAPYRFNEDNFWQVANSYDETRTPTMGTIVHHARAGGWNG